jgi:hypothetical protein
MGWRKLCTVRAVGAAAERDATVYAPLLELDPGVEGSADGGFGGGGGICAARKLGGACVLTGSQRQASCVCVRGTRIFSNAPPLCGGPNNAMQVRSSACLG